MMRWFGGLVATATLTLSGSTFAQTPPAPPPPEKVQVILRYSLPRARVPHVVGYDKLIADLKALAFEFDPPLEDRPETDREDTSKHLMRGKVAWEHLDKLMSHPGVANLLVAPADAKIPEGDVAVRVRLELSGALAGHEQQDLADQTRLMLELLGFREAFGADHRGYTGRPFTRIVGEIKAHHLETLLKDLRRQPAGWFDSKFIVDRLPAPLRDVNPVHVVEVLADPQPLETPKTHAKRDPETLEKIAEPDHYELAAAKKEDLVRVETLFSGDPASDQLRRRLAEAVPTFQVEGVLGNVVTGSVPAVGLVALAAMPEVSTIRRPHVTLPDVYPGTKGTQEAKAVLRETGLASLHQAGHKGRGVRIAILDRDFRHWKKYVEAKELPKTTRLVDLTTEWSPDVVPAPEIASDVPGHGTLLASAAAQAAPDAEIVLVRLDPRSPYQIAEVFGYSRGERFSDALVRRFDEMQQARADLVSNRMRLAAERKAMLLKFPDEAELQTQVEFSFLGPAFGWVFSEREWHRQKMAHQDGLEQALAQREERYRRLLASIRTLQGVDLIVNPFTWNDGHPLGGSSPLTRWFNLESVSRQTANAKGSVGPPSLPLAFQSVGNVRGQTWTGLFRDGDRNGVMEFAPPSEPIGKGRWTRELNFLAWQPFNGVRSPELIAETRLRISLQWREPHEPEYYELGKNDPYRRPLMNLRIVLLHQRDLDAKEMPADSFELIARTGGWPQRLQHQPNGAVYEHVLEASLPKVGAYAVRIERQLDHLWLVDGLESEQIRPTFRRIRGLNPTGLRPVDAPTLPVLEKNWEFRPRLFVEATDDPKHMDEKDNRRLQGRPVFADYATDQGTIGVPADARGLFAVSNVDLQRKTTPYGAVGTPAYLDLAERQMLFMHDQVGDGMGAAYGSPVATAFAAGMSASLLSSGLSRAEVETWLRQNRGAVLRVPPR